MLKQYETVFIVTPVLSDAQMKETVKKYADLITSNGGEIVSQEDWGLKKLAYPIANKTTGYYNLIEFRCEPDFIQTLEIQFGREEERIIRHLIVAMDKNAVAYAEHRRAKRNEHKEESEKPGEKEEFEYREKPAVKKTEESGGAEEEKPESKEEA
jgi:small subunit ribosomal protein S6